MGEISLIINDVSAYKSAQRKAIQGNDTERKIRTEEGE